MCELAGRIGFERVALIQSQRDGVTTHLYVWRRTEAEVKPSDLVTMIIPLGSELLEGIEGIELSIARHWSLETVGRRVSLVGRLVDEYSLARRQAAQGQAAGRATLTVLTALGLVNRDKVASRAGSEKQTARSSQA